MFVTVFDEPSYGGASYVYSPAGDLQSKTDGSGATSYLYDELGNLTHVHLPNGNKIDYVIDGQNRRIAKKVNGLVVQRLLYAGDLRLAAELDGAGAIVSRFVYATRLNVPDLIVRASSTYRIVGDHLGSPRVIIDTATGAIAERLTFDELGNTIQDTAPGFQPFGFAGGISDLDTKATRFGARDYDPSTGRWTAKDPLGFQGGDTGLYNYVGGDPINRVDSSGLVTSVVVFYNGFMGWHSALSIASNDGEEFLYDPSGGYTPKSGERAGTGRTFYGREASLDDFLQWHQTDSTWRIFNFDTTPEEERMLKQRAEELGGGGSLDCADHVSTVLSGVGRFKKIRRTSLPGVLADQLNDLLFSGQK